MDDDTITALLEERYAAVLNQGDADGYARLYSDDVLWGAPNLPDARSPAEIRALLAKMLGKVRQHLAVHVDDVIVHGDLAVATAMAEGTAARMPDGDPQPIAIRALWVLRREEGEWKIIRQVGTPKPVRPTS
jgi:uncharacterized protein (TIGR02246 family)